MDIDHELNHVGKRTPSLLHKQVSTWRKANSNTHRFDGNSKPSIGIKFVVLLGATPLSDSPSCYDNRCDCYASFAVTWEKGRAKFFSVSMHDDTHANFILLQWGV
jgi:hypothetical protein